MTNQTEPDVDVESWSDKRLADYINENAERVADLPDDAPAVDVLRANVNAALEEFRARNGDNSEDLTIDTVVDAEVGADEDHYLRHVAAEETEFKIRHERAVRTEVEDGEVVHRIFESADDAADAAAVSWSKTYYSTCAACGADVETEADDGDQYVQTWSCDECPWEVRRASTSPPNAVADDTRAKPLWSRTTYPHDFEDDVDLDWEKARGNADDVEDVANVARTLYLNMNAKALGTFKDKAYVSAEYDGSIADDDREKVADAYIETVECGNCDTEVDAPAAKSHAAFGDVCPDCEDVTVWSVDDADLPDDVEDRMNEHKTFSRGNITALLRDVLYWGNHAAAVDKRTDSHAFAVDDEDVDPEDVGPIKTGKQGRRSMGRGDTGRKGTGLRRPKGFAHNNRHFRTVLRDAQDTGLIRRVDDRDTDVDDKDAAWEATDKGKRVFDELARCPTCGDKKVPMIRTSTYKVGRSKKRDFSLTTACPTCDDLRSKTDGAMVLESSGTDWSLGELPGVEY